MNNNPSTSTTASTSANDKANSASATASGRNLMDTAAANPSFKTFGKAVESAGLAATLNGPGPFTIFAPTDAAFAKLPSGKLDNLLKPENKDELVSMLKYHVVDGRRSAADVGKWTAARTISGQSAPIAMKDGKFCIDGANVTEADIGSSNGVIHGIDKVNLPATSATTQ